MSYAPFMGDNKPLSVGLNPLGIRTASEQLFTTLLPGASVKATNMNMSNKPYATIKQANKQYTITVNMYLTGACIHNFYEVKNGAASISVTASGTSSHN